MNQQRLINRALELQAIPAPTFHEGQRSEYLLHAFSSSALDDVGRDDIGNVFAKVPGGSNPP